MAPAIPLIAAAAGAGVAASSIGATITLGLGLGFSGAITAGYIAGAVVATSINAIGSRALGKKPKAASFTAEAQGRAYTVRSSVDTHKVIYGRARVSGPLAFAATTDRGPIGKRRAGFYAVIFDAVEGNAAAKKNAFLHMVIPVAGHEVDGFEAFYLNEQRVELDPNGFATTAPYAKGDRSYVRARFHSGHPDQPADETLMAEVPAWTASHRLRGVAYAYVRLEYDADVFPTGIPNASFVVRGKKPFDPRTGLTQWSDNAVLCIRDYLASDYGFACDASEINDAHAVAAANVAEETVGAGNRKRFSCNGVLDTGVAPLENLQQLVTSIAGAVTYVQGKFRIHAAAFDSPAGALTDDMLAGGAIQTTIRTPRKDLFNAVKGTYVEPDKGWQPTDFPPVTSSVYEQQDGERIARDIEFPFVTDPNTAQRLAKIVREKARQGITQTLAVNHSAMKYAVYDVITRTDPQHGWVDKPFRITRFNLDGAITMTIQEESAASYDWDDGEASPVDTAPDTNLPNPAVVEPPGTLTVAESKYVTRSGDGVKAMATLTWGPSPDAFARDYQPEYRELASDDWKLLPRTTATVAEIEDISPGSYQFRVKAINNLGVSSPYTVAARQISGLLDPPPAPPNLTIATIGGMALLRWDEFVGNATLDVRIGGKVVFRHSPDPGGTWGASTTIGNAVPGTSTVAVLPLKGGLYLAKAVDSSGVQSVAASTVLAAQATALAYTTLDTITESPAFPGTKTGVVLDGAAIKLAGTGLFDSIPDFDAVPDLDAYGGTATQGSYEFSAVMDLTAVRPVRLTGTVEALITQIYDKLDSRSLPMDEWEDFDGNDAAAGDATLYVSQTADDPTMSPTWGPWHRLDSGEFVARAFRFKLEMMVDDPTYNIAISQLSVTAEEVS